MAAPGLLQASTGATDATGAFTFTGSTNGFVGNVIILHVVIDGSGAISWGTLSGTNIESLAAVANTWTEIGAFHSGGAVQQRLFIGRRTSASSAPTFSATANTSGDDVYGRMYEFQDVSAGTTLATVIENATAGGTSTAGPTASATVSDASVQTLGADRLALNFIGINDDNLQGEFTGESNGNFTTLVGAYADSGGTDASVGLAGSYATPLSAAGGLGGFSNLHGDGGAASFEQQGQQFTTVGAITTSAVRAFLRREGSPSDDVVIELQTDDGTNRPSGTVLGSQSFTGSAIDSSGIGTWLQADISVSLSASTKYWVVIRRTAANDSVNRYGVAVATNTSVYSGGGQSIKSGGTWPAAISTDLAFAVISTADQAGVTIDGGTWTQVDATDTWATVGFALIGTTAPASALVLNQGFVDFNDPGVL